MGRRDKPRFNVGDRVIDTDAEDETTLIVLNPDRGQASTVRISALDTTVAAVNPEYSPQDRVVECIHETWLERHASRQWMQWPDEAFPERLHEFASKWRLQVQTYDFPEGRLEPVSEPKTDSNREGKPPGQSSMDDWFE